MKSFPKLCAMKLVGLFAFLSIVSMSSKAQDYGEMQLNTDYSISMFEAWSGTYTATETGTLKIIGAAVSQIFEDENRTLPVNGEHSGYSVSPQFFSFSVTQGVKYYMGDSFPMSDGTIRLEMKDNSDFALASVNPEQDTQLSVTASYPYLSINFTGNVASVSSVILSCNGANKELAYEIDGSNLRVEYQEALLEIYETGASENDDVTIKISGLTNDGGYLYNEDGNLTLTYKLAPKPTTLVSATLPEVFKSYWFAGDEDAKCSFVFSSNLAPINEGQIQIRFGNAEMAGNNYYTENVPFVLNGNTLTVDLSGVRRTPADMIASGTNTDNLMLRLGSLKDDNGNLIYSNSSSQGSFTYLWQGDKYRVLEKSTVAAEFTPENGASLNGVNEISVFIYNAQILKFDGFTISYVDNEQTKEVLVPMSDVTVETESDGATYTFAVPQVVKGKKTIKVTLTNVLGIDGYDYSNDVFAKYDQFAIIISDPENGAKLAKFDEGQVFTVITNYDDLYPELYMEYQIFDMNEADPDKALVHYSSTLYRQDDGSFAAENYQPVKLYKNHTYEVKVTAWETEDSYRNGSELGATSIYWYGDSEPYVYSTVTFYDIYPNPQDVTTLTKDDNEFFITFEDLVNIDADHAYLLDDYYTRSELASIEAVNGEPGENGLVYANQWKLTVDPEWMAQQEAFYISVQAFDTNGVLVEGNNDEPDDESRLMFYYRVANNGDFASITISPEADSQVTTLDRFVISAESAIELGSNAECYVSGNRNRYPLTFSRPEGEMFEDNTIVYLSLNQPITDPGTYTLHIDAGFFVIDGKNSPAIDASYTVSSAPTSDVDVIVADPNPEDGSIAELETIRITFVDYSQIGLSYNGSYATLTINGGSEITLPEAELDWDIWNLAILSLGTKYTESGTYIVKIPAGYFLLGEDGSRESSEINLVYTVGANGISIVTADAQGLYNIYNVSGVKVKSTRNVDEINNLPAGIYIVNGKKLYIK